MCVFKSKMEWLKAVMVLLPVVTGQIIFPGEMESLSSSTISSRTTTVPPVSSSLVTTAKSLASSTSVFSSSLISSFSVVSTTSPVSSISLSLDPLTPTKPGSVSKALTTPVLRPSPVTSGPEVVSTSSLESPKRPSPDSLHPEVPHIGPVTPTPINVHQTAPSTFPGKDAHLDFEPEPPVETTISSSSLTSASAVASTPVVSTPELTLISLVPVRTTSDVPPSGESAESAVSSSTPEEFSNPVGSSHQGEPSHPRESSHHDESSDQGDSPSSGDLFQRDDSSHKANSSKPEESSHQDDSSHQSESLNPGTSFTTEKAVTREPQSTTTLDPVALDQMLTNAVITMGDTEDVDVGNSTCLTPLGETGTCIVFKDCAGYSPLVNHMDNKVVINFLRTRVCRLLPRAILFCCPDFKPVLPLGF